MLKKSCHLGSEHDPTCVGCEAVNDEKEINYVQIGRTLGCSSNGLMKIIIDDEKAKSFYPKSAVHCPAPQEESKIEHCDEPKCPACNTAAYERGRKDERERVVKEIYRRMLLDKYNSVLISDKVKQEAYMLGIKHQRDWVRGFALEHNITLSEAEEGK